MTVPALSLAAIRQPAFLWTPDGRVASANDLAGALAGRRLEGCTAAEIIAIFGNRHPDGAPFTPEDLPPSRALAGEEAIDVPMAVTAADGRTVQLLVTASPLREGGAIAGALVLWQDVTPLEAMRAGEGERRREAEAATGIVRAREEEIREQADALDRQRRLLDTILGTLPYRVSLWDRDERLVWANSSFAADCGGALDNLRGRRWDSLGRPALETASITECAREAVMTDRAVTREYELAGPAGTAWRACTALPFGQDGILVITEEITGRKRAEQELAYPALLSEWMSDAVIATDTDLRVTAWNRAAEDLYGWTADEAIGRLAREATGTVITEAERQEWLAGLGRGVSQTHRVLQHHRDGRPLIVEGRSGPIHDSDGRLVGYVGVNRDVTGQERLQCELAASEAKYRTLFETMNEGFMLVEPVLDEQGVPVSFRHLEVNPAKERISRLSREELVGRDVREILPGIEPVWIETYTRVALTGKPAHLEEYASELGAWLSVDAYSPAPGKAAVICTDITARKEAEMALVESEWRQAFLLALGDRLRGLDGVREVASSASEMVGRHLGANGVVYCEIDPTEQYATVRADWTDGTLPSAAGRFRMDDFGIGDLYRNGGVRRTSDVTTALEGDEADEHCALRIRASLGVPVFRGGTLAAVLAVHSARPRTWTDAEVEIVREAGDRIWAAVERARAEERLRESEAAARSFMENMLDAVAICETVYDAAGEPADIRVVEVNPAFLRELSLAAEQVVGRTASSLFPATDRSWYERFFGVGRIGTPVEVEEPFAAFGGWYHVAAFPVRGGRVAVVFHDITAQREAETALRERDLRLNLALDVAAIGTFDWNPVTGEETWDDRIRAQWGLSPGTPVDHGVFEAGIHPDDLPDVEAANRRALDPAGDGRYAARYRVIGRDGVERRIASRGQVFFETGRAVRMIGTTIDVTEQERVEEAARAQERLVQSIFRAAPAGIGLIMGLRPGRRFVQVNEHLLEMTGYDRDELIGHDSRILYSDDAAYLAVGEESALQLAEAGRGEVETQWRRKDGTVLEILLSSSLVDPANPDGGVIFAALDITDLRETEKALQRYARGLRQSNEELQRFAYVASHDLQEPLRTIVSFSQLLEKRYRGKLDQDADEFIGFIVEGGTRMQALIQDLLQVSRVETQAKPLQPTDAAAVVADALRMVETRLAETGATVEVGDLPAVMADETQLAQVFANLIGNAAKYRREDVPLVVRIEGWRVGPMVEFAVQDNGIGIEPEYHDRIFEMFRRLHTHDQYGGTGIGLAVVKKIVDRHGGRVWVESTPGEGSTFFFTLPAA